MKTEQERIDYLANRIRDFQVLVSGGGVVEGGFGPLPPIGQGDITIEHLEKSFSEFRLTGTNGIQAHGSLQNGYLLFGNPPAGSEGTGFSPPPPPPSPPPPTATGACCVGSDCSIETEEDCVGMGGDYQGNDVPCDPNPCPLPSCNGCGFEAFDGSGRKFLTKRITRLENDPPCCDGGGGVHDFGLQLSYDAIITIDPSGCSQSTDVITSSCVIQTDCSGGTSGCTAGPLPSPPYVVSSATYKSYERNINCGYAPTCPDLMCYQFQDETLSDECEP